jgi:hypothetical protein
MAAHDEDLPMHGRETAIDIGSGVLIDWDDDGGGLLWHHEGCRGWLFLRFAPDPRCSGHVLVDGGPHNPWQTDIEGSLVCPRGCGKHGFIRNGQWVPA